MERSLRLEQAPPSFSKRAIPDSLRPEDSGPIVPRGPVPGRTPGRARLVPGRGPWNTGKPSDGEDFLEKLMMRLDRQREKPRTAHHHIDFYIRVAESKQRSRVELKKTFLVYPWLALKPAVFFRPLNTQPWDEPKVSLRVEVKLRRFFKFRLLPLTENFWEASMQVPLARWRTNLQLRYRQETMSPRKPERAWRLTVRREPFRLRLFAGTDKPSSIDYRYPYVGNEMSAITFRGAWRFDVNPQYMAQYSAELKRRF